jgi:hypothetical protein
LSALPADFYLNHLNQKGTSMKTKSKSILRCTVLILLSIFSLQLPTARAQGTAFTYQGRLNDGGTPANGTNYGMVFYLYDAQTNGNLLGNVGIPVVSVSNGLFIVPLNFSNVFDGNPRWLEINVQKNGGSFTTLVPRQQLTPTPYAIMANSASNLLGALPASQLSGSISSATLTGSYTNTVTFNNGSDEFYGTFSGTFYGPLFIGGSFSGAHFGDGSGLFNLPAVQLNGTIPAANLANAWKTTGNAGTTAGVNFAGTTDNQPMELHVNGVRALRLEPTPTNGAVNMIGGSPYNYVVPGIVGATIGGGGFGSIYGGANSNVVMVDFATIGGGWGNLGVGYAAVVAGGYQNQNNGFAAFLGAGDNNIIVGAGGGDGAFLGGGYSNTNGGEAAVLVGGTANFIGGTANNAFIGAGAGNSIVGSYALPCYDAIAGGYLNVIQTNTGYAVIGGGLQNIIHAGGDHDFIGGGYQNIIFDSAHEATIAGGANCTIGTNDYNGFIGGGWENRIQDNADYATIPGGVFNVIQHNAANAVIAGGFFNLINGANAVIAGGQANAIGDNATAAAIGGGYTNTASGNLAMIPGGDLNVATNNAFAAGHRAKAVNSGSFVWADSTEADFSSTTSNQFAVRAGGGIAFVTGGAGMTVDGLNILSGAGFTNFWQLNGNAGTTAGAQFVGTTDNQPLELRVKGQRALRLEPDNSGPGAPNVIGGANGVTVGPYAATIGGGFQNTNEATYATIAGGNNNLILGGGINSTIGGGINNTNFGPLSTIPGGVGNSAGGNAFAAGSGAQAGNQGSFVWADATGNNIASTNNNAVTMRAAGGFQFYTSSAGRSGPGLYVAPNGISWISISDRNAKKDFAPVDYLAVLDKLSRVPVQQWHYKWETAGDTPNLGPMAQDFIAAFYPGRDDKGISTLEFDGVELAAIQGLNQKLNEKNAEIQELKRSVEQLQALVSQMVKNQSPSPANPHSNQN